MSTKAEQVEALVKFLDDPGREELTVREVAERIVDSFYELLLKGVKEAPMRLHEGQPWKCTLTGKIKQIAWSNGKLFWVVSSDSRYGYLGPLGPWEKYATKTTAKPLNLTNADGWQAGDRAGWMRHGWGKDSFAVLAVTEKAVLLIQEGNETPFIEPNDAMEKLYRKKRTAQKGLFD